jgi:beta-xylosidase
MKFKKPSVTKQPVETPVESDEFNDDHIGLQWQWMSNPSATWAFANKANGSLRMYSVKQTGNNLWENGNVLLQKFPADSFSVITRINFHPNTKLSNERAGLVIMGLDYAGIGFRSDKNKIYLAFFQNTDADKGRTEEEIVLDNLANGSVILRADVRSGGIVQFSYSLDGKAFISYSEPFHAKEGKWKGAKVGIFCSGSDVTNDSGWADFDWFRVF